MSAWSAVRAALRDFRRPWLWLGVWVGGWLLCVLLSVLSPPQVEVQLPEGDKLGHFLAYAALSAWSVLLFARPRGRWTAALLLVALGVAMELAQGTLTSSRMMDPRDAVANLLGVITGQMLAFSRAAAWLQRWDARLFG